MKRPWFLRRPLGRPSAQAISTSRPAGLSGWLVLAGLICFLNAGHAATNDFFARGVELSRAGQFPEASVSFESSAQVQPAAGTLVDLGLAEWRRGRAGAAILAWEQARWIDPFDARALGNLKFARQAAQVDEPQLKWFEAVSAWLPPNAWAWLTGVTLWLAVGLVLLPGIFRRPKAGWHQWLAALALGGFFLSLTADGGTLSRTHLGFVVRKNAPLQLTPTQGGEIITTLAAGEPVRKGVTRGNYVYVRTLGGAGWLDRADFRLVCPP
jgi:hypothetical protein